MGWIWIRSHLQLVHPLQQLTRKHLVRLLVVGCPPASHRLRGDHRDILESGVGSAAKPAVRFVACFFCSIRLKPEGVNLEPAPLECLLPADSPKA